MSIEDAINNHAAAVRDLAAALHGKATSAPASQTKKPEADKAAGSSKPAPEAKAVGVGALDFNQIRDSFVAMVKTKGQQSAVDLLAHFGQNAAAGGKLSSIPAERHAELAQEIAKRSA